MDGFEFNKYVGALLGSAVLLFVINLIGNFAVHPTLPAKTVIAIELPEKEAAAPVAAAMAATLSLAELMAAADAAKGQKVAKKCAACHGFEKAGKHKIGPNLYGVLGRAKAAAAGYAYSAALKGLGGAWSFADLDAFLTKPKEFAKGTKMAFGGIKKPADRAALMAYMLQFHDSPPALPSN